MYSIINIKKIMKSLIKNDKLITICISIYWLLLQAYKFLSGQEYATFFEILVLGMVLNLYIEHKSK